MNSNDLAYASVDFSEDKKEKGFSINLKRVLARALRFWYVIALATALALVAAFIVNRYSPKVYPINASIIILQSEENVGSKFLYDNELINPFRNYYNELYIMRSYPLLAEVVQELNFDVSFFREGNIRTTEYYDPDFPVRFEIISQQKPYGRTMNFTVDSDLSFSLELLFDEPGLEKKTLEKLAFNDTIKVNGFSLVVKKTGDVSSLQNKLFLVRFNDPFVLARWYSQRLIAAWAQQGASVVNLEVRGEVPQKEVNFLNKFIEKYQQYDIDKKNKMATNAIAFLNTQLRFMGDSLGLLEDKVEDFKHRNVITNLGGETGRLYIKLEGLEEQRLQYKLKENYYSYIIPLVTSESYDGIFTPSSVGVTDPVVSGLITSLIDARARLNRYQGIERKEENPLYREQVLRINQIRADILKTIENNKKTEAINLKFVDEQIKVIREELRSLPSSERELKDIQRDYSLKESLYVFLLQKKTEAGLSKASTTSDIVVVNPPLASGPIFPKQNQNYMFALAAGLLLPLAVFVMMEVFNNRIQSKEDIEKLTSVPLIGGVGHNPTDDQMIVAKKPRSALAESFRALRSNLNYFAVSKKRCYVYMVTSSLPGEGKSFTTLNVASVFAMAGRKTIIVGADLRRPKLYDELGLNNSVGLSQYLSNAATKENIIQQSAIQNLSLIAGGPMPPNPSELLLRPEMENLLVELQNEFDTIIIDTPPLSLVADAFVLSRFVDHTIFVVRQNFTPTDVLKALEDYYLSSKIKNVSILFNDLRKSGMGYGYETYAYSGYGYYVYGDRRKNATAGYYQD